MARGFVNNYHCAIRLPDAEGTDTLFSAQLFLLSQCFVTVRSRPSHRRNWWSGILSSSRPATRFRPTFGSRRIAASKYVSMALVSGSAAFCVMRDFYLLKIVAVQHFEENCFLLQGNEGCTSIAGIKKLFTCDFEAFCLVFVFGSNLDNDQYSVEILFLFFVL